MSELLDETSHHEAISHDRLVIAIDFGTTYSAVSYVAIPQGVCPDTILATQIRSIQNFPESFNFTAGDVMLKEIPTEVMYPLNRNFRRRMNKEFMQQGLQGSINNSLDREEPRSDIDAGIDYSSDEEMDDAVDNDTDDRFRWGYEVHGLRSLSSTHSNRSNQPLTRFKLMLDVSETTKELRAKLNDTLEALQQRKIIKEPSQVITDYLTCLLRHTQSQLRQEGFDDSYRTEIVLCVPALWTQRACRIMQTCLAMALKSAGFSGVNTVHNSIENLFIVSEPEAAAAYMLTVESDLSTGDFFVLLDAGGGTVDANTYQISSEAPLRLSREMVEPGGGLCGSSYLNEEFQRHLYELLKTETYLEQGVVTINGIIEKIIIDQFEYRIKRSFDYNKPSQRQIDVPGLRDNPEKGFRNESICIHGKVFKKIFRGIFEKVAKIMEGQIRAVIGMGYRLEKVVLIGGFAASKSLTMYLERHLEKMRKEFRGDFLVTLMNPNKETANAVASGAVIRALNKARGPRRVARSSYGILRREPFGEHPQHDGQKAQKDRHDGHLYLKKTIYWVLKSNRRFICNEVLYVSDTAKESHYPTTNERNLGAEKLGEIEVDFSFLKQQKLISPTIPEVDESTKGGRPHYEVRFTIIIRIVDRDLECYAKYNDEVIKKCKINIASGFRPGVK